MGLYLSSVTINQACVAQGQVRRAAARWIGCAAFFIGWCVLPLISEEFRRVEIGFALTAGLLLTLLYVIYRRPHERAEDVPRAGSTEELEARLAAVEEGGDSGMSAERAASYLVLREASEARKGSWEHMTPS